MQINRPCLQIFIIFQLIAGSLLGQSENQERLINYLQNDFKIKEQIWGIETNPSNGLVYFATNTGLLEFDGLSFTKQDFAPPGAIRSICIDNNNILQVVSNHLDFGKRERIVFLSIIHFPIL
jgi:hypothetical protein